MRDVLRSALRSANQISSSTEAVGPEAAVRFRFPEDAYAERAQQPQHRSEKHTANEAVDNGYGCQAAGRDVDLRVEKVEQVGDVEAEDRAREHALEVRPAYRHAAARRLSPGLG